MVLTGLILATVLWGAYRAYRAHTNLVTLTVRNMEVRRVVSKLEWQTWEKIVLSKDVGGKVTLLVRDVPLDEVLNIIGLQTDSRWTRLYPLYSTKKSLATFYQVLQGEVLPAGNGWSGLERMASWQQAGLGRFANTLRAENKLVSAQLADKDVAFTALAISRFSRAQVLPEDDTKGVINLRLQQVPLEEAVSQVAQQVNRKWVRVYTLQPLNPAALVRQEPTGSATTNATPFVGTNSVPVALEGGSLPPEQAMEALVSTMTPEEQQQTLEQIALANSSGAPGPGGGQAQMQPVSAAAAQAAQAAQQDLQRRIDLRLKDGTVDQRLAHDRRVLSSKQAGPNP
jgi:hypothetical protein